MADVYTWVKNLPDIIKSYWLMLMMGITALSGLSTGGYQYFDKQEMQKNSDAELESALKQTAIIAEHLGKFVPVPEKPAVKSDCGACRTMWLNDLKKLDSKMTKQIGEWHGK